MNYSLEKQVQNESFYFEFCLSRPDRHVQVQIEDLVLIFSKNRGKYHNFHLLFKRIIRTLSGSAKFLQNCLHMAEKLVLECPRLTQKSPHGPDPHMAQNRTISRQKINYTDFPYHVRTVWP